MGTIHSTWKVGGVYQFFIPSDIGFKKIELNFISKLMFILANLKDHLEW